MKHFDTSFKKITNVSTRKQFKSVCVCECVCACFCEHIPLTPLSPSIFFPCSSSPSVSVRMICHHLRSGRGVTIVMLTILQSRLNLIGWISCDAVLVSVLLFRLFTDILYLVFCLWCPYLHACLSVCMCVCVCVYIRVLIAERFLSEGCISWMSEWVGSQCQAVQVSINWSGCRGNGGGQEAGDEKSSEAWPASSDRGPREITLCFTEIRSAHRKPREG